MTTWSVWETELGMVCASLPAIRHLFKKIWPNMLATISRSLGTGKETNDASFDHSAGGSRRDRSNVDNRNYYELDERSLISKGKEGISTTSITVVTT